ncbi:MAG: hypothetical protein C4523_02585 [Myxococcales bacterium]|jgi:hypothetical protein|nr:MAG: hypothetical protein C4523_02585 [Myxococcales bacterium]
MNPKQFTQFVIYPVLQNLGMWSPAASHLVLGTALVESNLHDIDQIIGSDDGELGPALGIYQIEPQTHWDLYHNFLDLLTGDEERDFKRQALKGSLLRMLALSPPPEVQLVTNLWYATAICRLIYYRRPEPLPPDSPAELARYYKLWFNTAEGKSSINKAIPHFERACAL